MAEQTIFGRAWDFIATGAVGGYEPEPEAAIEPEDTGYASVPDMIAKARTDPAQMLGVIDALTGGVAEIIIPADARVGLVGMRRWRKYDELVRDTAIVGAGLRAFMYLLAAAEWASNPPEGEENNAEAQGYADTLYSIIYGMKRTTWSSVVRKTAMYRFAGFVLQEWSATQRDDGVIALFDVQHRPQCTITRWNRDQNGQIESVVQTTGGGEVTIPITKLVYAVDDIATDSPEGIGLFRHLSPIADKLRLYEALEEVGFETDLRGIPIVSAPLGELKEEVDKTAAGTDARKAAEATRSAKLKPFKDFLDRHVRNKKTGILKPSDTYVTVSPDTKTVTATDKWKVELLNGDAQSFDSIAKAIDRKNQEMARLIGVEHMLLGSTTTGSFALSQSKTGMFYLTLTATLSDLVEVYERDIVTPIATLNGWPEELWPVLGVAELDETDVGEIATALMNLATAGAPITPDDPVVGALRDRMGLPRVPDDQVQRELDLSLNPQRNDPQPLPDQLPQQDTQPVKKVRWITSRRSQARAAMKKGRR